MRIRTRVATFLLLLAASGCATSGAGHAGKDVASAPLVIQQQGSFAVGGSVVTNPGPYDAINRSPAGQTIHGDHAYVFYQGPCVRGPCRS